MAMASKAKMLLRELKTVRGDLTFLRDRCAQLEEENRRLRESVVKGTRPDEDDLVCFTFYFWLWQHKLLHYSSLQVFRRLFIIAVLILDFSCTLKLCHT